MTPIWRNATHEDFKKMKKIDEIMYNNNRVKVNICDNNINTNYTRLNINNNDFRENMSNASRFEIPLYNPENNVYYGFSNTWQYGNSRFGQNSRDVIKKSIEKQIEPIKKMIRNY